MLIESWAKRGEWSWAGRCRGTDTVCPTQVLVELALIISSVVLLHITDVGDLDHVPVTVIAKSTIVIIRLVDRRLLLLVMTVPG